MPTGVRVVKESSGGMAVFHLLLRGMSWPGLGDKLIDTRAPPLPSAFLQSAEVLKLLRTKRPLGKCYSAHPAISISLGFAMPPSVSVFFPPAVWLQSWMLVALLLAGLALHLQVINLAEMVVFNSSGWLIKMSATSFLRNVLCVLHFFLLSTQCLFEFPSLFDELYLYHSGRIIEVFHHHTTHIPVFQEAWFYGPSGWVYLRVCRLGVGHNFCLHRLTLFYS